MGAETWAAVESALNAGDAATKGLYTEITNGETYTLYSKTSFEQRYNIQKAAYSLNTAIDNVATELKITLTDDDPEPACTPTTTKTENAGTSAEIQGDSTSGVVYFQALAREMETKVKDLEAKIKSGDLNAAQASYVASRPRTSRSRCSRAPSRRLTAASTADPTRSPRARTAPTSRATTRSSTPSSGTSPPRTPKPPPKASWS